MNMSKFDKLKIKCFKCGKHLGYIYSDHRLDINKGEISNIKHDDEYFFIVCDQCAEEDDD